MQEDNKTQNICKNCGRTLLPSHVGPCPNCGGMGKVVTYTANVTVGLKAAGTTLVNSDVRRIEERLAENEKGVWHTMTNYLKNNVVIDGFEIGFPSGLKVMFKVKQDNSNKE